MRLVYWMLVCGSFVLALAVLLSSCAMVRDLESSGPDLRDPEWSDTDFVLDTIACALERKYGAAAMNRIMRFSLKEAGPDYPLREYIGSQFDPPRIILRGDQPSAIRTPLRHAVFAHLVPCDLTRRGNGSCDWNFVHSEAWKPLEAELKQAAGKCGLEIAAGEHP